MDLSANRSPATRETVSRLATPGVPDQGPSRLLALDLARVLAILFMIQGHALDVLLAPPYREGVVFDVWLFLRGLTAPLFFSLAGVSFMFSSLRHWEAYAKPSWRTLRRLGRFSFFILLGYAMHLPARSLSEFAYVDATGWQGWWQVDVLQCIGLTLMGLQALFFSTRTPERMARWAIGLGAGVVVLTPLAWAVDWGRHLPAPLAAYFSAGSGSLFPLFPWAGYVLCGCALGYALQQRTLASLDPARPLALGGLALIVAGVVLSPPLLALFPGMDFWRTSPSMFLVRAGCVCGLLAAVCYLPRLVHMPGKVLRPLAQESLLIYFVHVCILYGSIWNLGIRQVVGPALNLLPTVMWICALSLAMMLLAWSWNWLKRAAPARSYAVRFAALFLAITHPWV